MTGLARWRLESACVRAWAWALPWCLAWPLVWAQSPVPGVPAVASANAAPACDPQAWQTLAGSDLSKWQEAVPACQNAPLWLSSLGHLLNQQGQYARAAEHLERALMFEPDLLPARLDYALALAGTGDRLSARGLLSSTLASDQLQPPWRASLEQALEKLDSAAPMESAAAGWQTHGQASLIYGRDSNLLGAPDLKELSLTLDGFTLRMGLEPQYLAQAANYWRTDAAFSSTQRQGDASQWTLQGRVRQRGSAQMQAAGFEQFELAAERLGALESLPHGLGSYAKVQLAGIQSELGGRLYQSSLLAGLRRAWPWPSGACEARAGLQWQGRRLLDLPNLSGTYQGLELIWLCHPGLADNLGKSGAQWGASVRSGSERPVDATRPGGVQQQTSLSVQVRWPGLLGSLGGPGAWLIESEWAALADQQGYSSWLDNGVPRKLTRYTARAEYQGPMWRLGTGWAWQGVVGLEYSATRSNLALFESVGQSLYAGLRAHW